MIDTETLALIRRASTAELTDWWVALQTHRVPPPMAALGWPRPCGRSELLRLIESVVGQQLLHQARADELSGAQAPNDAARVERERCLLAVDQEPELPGDMPDAMWAAIREASRDDMAEMLRIVVRDTKSSIRERIISGASEPPPCA